MDWSPISEFELYKLIQEQSESLDNKEAEFFKSIKVPFEPTPIERWGEIETVFVVAKHDDLVIFYEDIEEGFEITKINSRGIISEYGASQFELVHVVNQLMSR